MGCEKVPYALHPYYIDRSVIIFALPYADGNNHYCKAMLQNGTWIDQILRAPSEDGASKMAAWLAGCNETSEEEG